MSIVSSSAPLPIVVAGPTCSGKSALALALAEALDGGIVCADSRQVYAGLEIASAAPDDDERARAPHLLFGAVSPTVVYDAGRFVDDADHAIDTLAHTGKRAIVVGGTGMYLRAWRHGLSDVPGADAVVRRALDDEIAEVGLIGLHARLARVDPVSAARIAPTDRVRVVRALEVHALTGQPASALRTSHDGGALRRRAVHVLLEADSEWLAARIDARTRGMFARGLVEEARALRAVVGPTHALVETLGVAEALAFDDGHVTREEAISQTSLRTRQYARRQRKWFHKEGLWARLDARDTALVARALDVVAEADR